MARPASAIRGRAVTTVSRTSGRSFLGNFGVVLCELRGELPKEIAGLRFDEIGIAQPDWTVADTPADKAHAYRVTRVLFERE